MSGILIADAGATKTQWSLVINQDESLRFKTSGINLIHQDKADLENILHFVKKYLGENKINAIRFFGAGCLPGPQKDSLETFLRNILDVKDVFVESDLEGAAKALFEDKDGIACILGTGSNSCLYKNGKISEHIPSLGYILGDEGSGAALGKRLLNGIFKKILSKPLREDFKKEYNLSVGDLIDKVYRRPMVSTFLASFSPFLLKHIANKEIQELVRSEFDSFFKKNVLNYPGATRLGVGFIGGIAYNFAPQLIESAEAFNLNVTKILIEPIKALEEYYKNQ